MNTIFVPKKVALLLFGFLLATTINASPNLIALVGGPGCGKTTLLQSLAAQGFKTLPEGSSLIIQDERVLGNNEPWKQRETFQRKILNQQLNLLASIRDFDGPVFSDRGIPDGIAYFYFDAQEPFNELRIAAQNTRYDLVFMLDFLENYDLDGEIRHEDQKEAAKIHALIKKAYEDLGYNLIIVPAMSVEDRAALVLSVLRERNVSKDVLDAPISKPKHSTPQASKMQ
jgi:predicted ATPase